MCVCVCVFECKVSKSQEVLLVYPAVPLLPHDKREANERGREGKKLEDTL